MRPLQLNFENLSKRLHWEGLLPQRTPPGRDEQLGEVDATPGSAGFGLIARRFGAEIFGARFWNDLRPVVVVE